MFEILPEFRTVPVANDVYMLAVLLGTQTERHTHDSEPPRMGLTSGHRVVFSLSQRDMRLLPSHRVTCRHLWTERPVGGCQLTHRPIGCHSRDCAASWKRLLPLHCGTVVGRSGLFLMSKSSHRKRKSGEFGNQNGGYLEPNQKFKCTSNA